MRRSRFFKLFGALGAHGFGRAAQHPDRRSGVSNHSDPRLWLLGIGHIGHIGPVGRSDFPLNILKKTANDSVGVLPYHQKYPRAVHFVQCVQLSPTVSAPSKLTAQVPKLSESESKV